MTASEVDNSRNSWWEAGLLLCYFPVAQWDSKDVLYRHGWSVLVTAAARPNTQKKMTYSPPPPLSLSLIHTFLYFYLSGGFPSFSILPSSLHFPNHLNCPLNPGSYHNLKTMSQLPKHFWPAKMAEFNLEITSLLPFGLYLCSLCCHLHVAHKHRFQIFSSSTP